MKQTIGSNGTFKCYTIDPGDTTGYVEAFISPSLLKLRPYQREHSCQELFRELKVVSPDIILIENFRCRNNSPLGLSMTSAHLIGVTMLYCQEYDIPLTVNEPAYGEGGHFAGIQNLKRAGVYVGGIHHHHAMEAMRHFMQWFTYGPGFQYNKSPQVVMG